MKLNKNQLTAGAILLMTLSQPVVADIVTFHFTGRLVVAGSTGDIVMNNGMTYTPIDASLTFDTVTGVGSSGLSIIMNDGFFGTPATFHDITMAPGSQSNLLDGNVFVDWNGNNNMSLHVEWDATGLFNALEFGLQVGDVISGTNLIRGGNTIFDVRSATPYSDILQANDGFLLPGDLQGPAPLAATSNSLGFQDGPFPGIRGYFDIGSGNSLTVTSYSVVPVPAAVWLFGSGLVALVGFTRRKV